MLLVLMRTLNMKPDMMARYSWAFHPELMAPLLNRLLLANGMDAMEEDKSTIIFAKPLPEDYLLRGSIFAIEDDPTPLETEKIYEIPASRPASAHPPTPEATESDTDNTPWEATQLPPFHCRNWFEGAQQDYRQRKEHYDSVQDLGMVCSRQIRIIGMVWSLMQTPDEEESLFSL